MGLEAQCEARMGRQTSAGKALLEEKDLIFRGDFRLKIPLALLRRIEARAGALHLEWPDGKVVLALGDQAARWADKIQHPPSLLDKLGVKAEFREDDVRAAALAAGLVDVKVARFSDTLSALKLVIPRAQR